MERFENIARISPEKLQHWIDEGKDLVLIDTLPKEHFDKIHLQAAQNACIFKVSFMDEVKAMVADKSKAIVVYGADADTMDALNAAEKLALSGYSQVYALEGGISRCRSCGLTFQGTAPDLPEAPEQVLHLEDRNYKVDLEKSIVEWAGRNPNSKHHGTVQLLKGDLKVLDGKISGTFDIDMSSIKNINLEGDPLQPVLINHLKSDDFFFVKMFPKATFTIQSAFPLKNPTFTTPNFEVFGVLDLRGVGADLQFPATLNRLQNGQIAVEAHFDIDRTNWNIIYGSSRFFRHLGMHLVFDLISFQVRIVAG
ncbi:MAG: YceI family protein [Deltaproteobacteria bacterium]|nr:YceI family protein [Deltaproteobacteria bacterium]